MRWTVWLFQVRNLGRVGAKKNPAAGTAGLRSLGFHSHWARGVMPLFWIVHRVNGEPRVYITEASSPMYARLEGAKAGILNPADFVEMHALDDATARKIPKTMRGRLLTQEEVQSWLDRMEA